MIEYLYKIDIIKELIIPIVIAIISVNLSLRKAAGEHLWKERYQLYNKIIEEIEVIFRYSEDETLTSAGYTPISSKNNEIVERYNAALLNVSRYAEIGDVLLSRAFANKLKMLARTLHCEILSMSDLDVEDPRFEASHDAHYCRITELSRSYLYDLICLAKKDIGISSFSIKELYNKIFDKFFVRAE